MELANKQGKNVESSKRCYLCKRHENEESIWLSQDSFRLNSNPLYDFDFEIEPGVKMRYLLCNECVILLSSLIEAGSHAYQGDESLFHQHGSLI